MCKTRVWRQPRMSGQRASPFGNQVSGLRGVDLIFCVPARWSVFYSCLAHLWWLNPSQLTLQLVFVFQPSLLAWVPSEYDLNVHGTRIKGKDCNSVDRLLPQQALNPGFNAQYCITLAWWHIPVISELSRKGRRIRNLRSFLATQTSLKFTLVIWENVKKQQKPSQNKGQDIKSVLPIT